MQLKFGAFMAPFHRLGEDPTGALSRDLELVEWLDTLGYDEIWVGEHHSGGWSPISSPELFLANAAARTRQIKLGTGVVSLPYHHPLMVAERIMLLDHLSRGRAMLGVGAGINPADAYMMGIAAGDQRRMMAESLQAVVQLLEGTEPVNCKTDWFELRDAAVQLRPYRRPALDIAVASPGSERGMRLAGRYGVGALTFAGRPGVPDAPLDGLWLATEDEANKYDKTVDRANWRVAICVHVAETREEALNQVRPGMTRWYQEYVRETIGAPAVLTMGCEVDECQEQKTVIIGSVDDVIEGIHHLYEETGGFGTLLINTHDWAAREQVLHSFDLFARYVAPHFTGALSGLQASQQWMATNRADFSAQGREAAKAAPVS
ncbi:LLM class flavin-dependent oxidoreductase [Micromonospora sp. DT228]|uniref:LLM class flavin-dependent oxidoreductase n=1 Tax=Micromonospora sp. DT228 TaxID=3393443 RepID=UPI003CF76777